MIVREKNVFAMKTVRLKGRRLNVFFSHGQPYVAFFRDSSFDSVTFADIEGQRQSQTNYTVLYSFFWVILRRLNFMSDVSEHCSIFIGSVIGKDQGKLYIVNTKYFVSKTAWKFPAYKQIFVD